LLVTWLLVEIPAALGFLDISKKNQWLSAPFIFDESYSY